MAYTNNKIKVPTGIACDRVKQVEDFLNEHYEIKINVFDTSKSFIVAKNKGLYEQEPNELLISLHMEREGIRGCDSILRKIIKSGWNIKTFNPITDYINSLEGAWKGKSHIDRFCSFLIARDFGDKSDGYYQERLNRLLKKWMAASIACALGIRQNDAMIGFIHASEGIGKTYIFEFLTPKLLKAYYTKSDKDPRFFNMTRAFSSKFIVNFDEMVGITNTNAETFKSVLSSTDFSMSNGFTQNIPRIGSGVFTSNKTQELGGFLTPNMGTRRFAVLELEQIIQNYQKEVDVDQLWAEAYVLFKNADFNYVWDKADYLDFEQYNAKYMIQTQAYKLIKEFYRVPEQDEESIHKQPIEILQDLRRARKVTSGMTNVTDVTIGQALKALGYEHKMKKVSKILPRYGYQVIPLFE